MASSIGIFWSLPDPRAANARHRLGDLLAMAVASALCGGETCVDFAQFARSRRPVLERLIGPFEPPSHDTFSRVFRLLDPQAFAAAFATFMAAFAKDVSGVVAVDGKALRRAYEAGLAATPPLMVTAWAAGARLALAATMPDPLRGESEVEAAMAVLALLDLHGATVTADALHCHRRMAAAVLERGGDYALCLKGNQSKLKRAAEVLLARDPDAARAETSETAHGRREHRSARVVAAPGFAEAHAFRGVAALAEVMTQRHDGAPKRRLFLLSRVMAPLEALAVVRAHWQIENALHWTLDVVLREDALRSRTGHAPANLALVTRLALNLINALNDPKTPKRRRIKRCAWEDDYLLNTLAQMR